MASEARGCWKRPLRPLPESCLRRTSCHPHRLQTSTARLGARCTVLCQEILESRSSLSPWGAGAECRASQTRKTRQRRQCRATLILKRDAGKLGCGLPSVSKVRASCGPKARRLVGLAWEHHLARSARPKQDCSQKRRRLLEAYEESAATTSLWVPPLPMLILWNECAPRWLRGNARSRPRRASEHCSAISP